MMGLCGHAAGEYDQLQALTVLRDAPEIVSKDGLDLTVIVLANYDAPITEAVARQIFRPLKRTLSAAGTE